MYSDGCMCVYHCRENRAKCGSVCVANHTTPIDIVMLAVDNSFTLVGLGNSLPVQLI